MKMIIKLIEMIRKCIVYALSVHVHYLLWGCECEMGTANLGRMTSKRLNDANMQIAK